MHSTHQNCGTSQALCTRMVKIADTLRLCAPPLRENCGTSKARCTPMVKIVDSLRLCAPLSRSLRGVSGSARPHHKITDSLGLWALSVHSIHQNCGASQALRTPMMKIADRLRLCAPPSRKARDVSGSVQPHGENCRQSQALCTPPLKKIAGRLRLCAPA